MTESNSSEVMARTAVGAVWMVALRVSVTLLGMISTLVLARILMPADFGLVALATAMLAGLELLTAFKFDVALIQNQSATRVDYDTAWTLNVLFGLVLAGMMLAGATVLSDFYEEPRLETAIWVIAATAFTGGFQNIGVVNFRKDLLFRQEFMFRISSKIASVIVGVSTAILFKNYWALLAGIAAASLTSLAASYLMHAYRPRFSLQATHRLMSFSKWLLADNAIYFLRHRSADFIIGKLSGTGSLGLFALGNELAGVAAANLVAPINRAVLPGYARIAREPGALQEGYLNVISAIALIAVPASLGMGVVAPLLVPLAFGSNWIGAVPLIQILSVSSVISTIGGGAPTVFLALGRPSLLVLTGSIYVTVLLTIMILLIEVMGLTGAAWAHFVAALVTLPVHLLILNRVLGVGARRWLSAVWRPLVASALMCAPVLQLVFRTPTDDPIGTQIAQLLLIVLAGVTTYCASLAGLWWVSGRPLGAERALLDRIGGWRKTSVSDA